MHLFDRNYLTLDERATSATRSSRSSGQVQRAHFLDLRLCHAFGVSGQTSAGHCAPSRQGIWGWRTCLEMEASTSWSQFEQHGMAMSQVGKNDHGNPIASPFSHHH
jgi:hypothetical protein